MASLYYLMASLPALHLDKEPSITYEQFLSYAEGALTPLEFKRLKAFNLSNPPETLDGAGRLERDYWGWDVSFRNELVKLRAAALGVDGDKYLRKDIKSGGAHERPQGRMVAGEIFSGGYIVSGSNGVGSTAVHEEAQRAFREDNPLKVEAAIDAARWKILENHRNGEFFTFNILLIYSMELQILRRRFSFEVETGRARYDEEYNRILKDAQQVLSENI
jgi:hypothetical protein